MEPRNVKKRGADRVNRDNTHRKVVDQHGDLVPKLLGHYPYYAIIGNRRALYSFYEAARSRMR